MIRLQMESLQLAVKLEGASVMRQLKYKHKEEQT
jgi:hypothetical protein